MRRENPPDGGHDIVIWKRSRECSRSKASRHSNFKTWWRLTTATIMGVSFGSYSRRRRDVLMRRRVYVPFRPLVTYHWDAVGYFIWDLFETLWWHTDRASSLRPLDTSSKDASKTLWRRTTETLWRRSTETLLGVSFESYLRRRWDV